MDKYKSKWWVLASVGLMVLLINIDSTIVNVALAKISISLNADLNVIQWVVSSYLLATAIFFTICGRLADMYGNKLIFLIGTAIFTIASLLCGLSPSAPLLISARFVQGIGFAATLGIAMVIINNAFPEKQRGLATGAAVTLTGLGQVVGPTVGGIILNFTTWHWIFFVNVPLGVICFFMTSYFAASDKTNPNKGKLDPIGIAMFMIGLAMVATTLNQTANLETGNVILFIAIGVILLGAFCYRSLHSKNPLIAAVLLTHKEYLKVAFTRIVFMYAWMSTMLFIPLYLQNVVGYTPLKTGLLILIMTAMIAITSPLTGRVIDKVEFKRPNIFSLFFCAVACLLLSQLNAQPQMIILVLALLIFGLGTGMHIPSTINGILRTSAKQHASTGMGLFFTIAFIGAIMGIAISGSYMSAKSNVMMLKLLVADHITIVSKALQRLQTIASGAHDGKWLQGHVANNQLPQLLHIANQSFMHTFTQLMWINTVLLLIGMFVATRVKMNKMVN
ncbi:MAG: MFS transporter [Coxiellaceae bacterium]|nr:MFS transporter [Coxiellaceae bacterium]